VLDDLKYIHQRDASDALGKTQKQWQQLQYVFDTTVEIKVEIQNVVVAGMGGSALAAAFIQTWPGLQVPFQVVRDYQSPGYVNGKTLFIASSYSGNTEETIAALAEAEVQGAQIAIIAAGGKLAEIAHEKGYPLFELPPNFQPRMAVFYNFAALIQLFSQLKLIPDTSHRELLEAAEGISNADEKWRADVPVSQNVAKQIALELVGKTPVIYGGPLLFPAAYKWKINMNEDSKNVAWCNQFSEFNHNEFLGWSSHPVEKPYSVVYLQSSFDHPQITKRFEISKRLLSGKMPDPIIIHASGESILEQLLWVITLGDYVALYLAFLNGIDPTPVDLIEKLKKELV